MIKATRMLENAPNLGFELTEQSLCRAAQSELKESEDEE